MSLAIFKHVEQQDSFREKLMQAVPSGIDKQRFYHTALSAVKSMNFNKDVKPDSVMLCLYGASILGLELDKTIGHAYIVPFGNEATLIIGYKGFVELARRSGAVTRIETCVVYENDEYEEIGGTYPKIVHRKWYTIGEPEPGDMQLVYCVAELKGGAVQHHSMPIAEIQQLADKQLSRLQDWQKARSPWKTSFPEMAQKTVIRRASKLWPQRSLLSKAVAWDEESERGEDQSIDPYEEKPELIEVDPKNDPIAQELSGEAEPMSDEEKAQIIEQEIAEAEQNK